MAHTRLVRGTLYITSGIMTGFCSRDLLGRPIFSTFMNERSLQGGGGGRGGGNLVILFPRFIDRLAFRKQPKKKDIFRGIRVSSERTNYGRFDLSTLIRFVNLIR